VTSKDKIKRVFGRDMPDWDRHLEYFLREMAPALGLKGAFSQARHWLTSPQRSFLQIRGGTADL
jgi:hypothetical protein